MDSNILQLFLYIIIIVFLFSKIYYKRKLFLLSPVDIFVFFFLAVIFFSTTYHFYYPEKLKFDIYNLDSINKKNFTGQINVFLRMLSLFLAGVFIFSSTNKKFDFFSRFNIPIIHSNSVKINYNSVYYITYSLFIICLLLVFLDYGAELFYRKKYIPKDNSIFKTIYTNLLIVLSVLSAILIRKSRLLGTVIIVSVVLIGIALGSRMATIDLAVFFVTYSVFINSKKKLVYYYIIVVPFIFLFFGYNLSLRIGSLGHGLVPYLTINEKKIQVILDNTLFNIYYTFVYGFYATSETIKLYSESTSKLLTCVSPLPGNLSNWYLFAQKMRINKFAPYTAVGELAKFPIFSFFYYLFLGFYFSFLEIFIKKSIFQRKYVFSVLIVLFICLMIMLSFEYNLRSAHRFVYYTFFLYIVSLVLQKFKAKKITWN